MPAYTENELARMRERAIASAREMQRRAAIKGGEQRQCNRPNPPPTRPEPPPKPPERPPKPPDKPKPQRPPVDNDRMLIIALIIILSADGADMLTIFALMYILMYYMYVPRRILKKAPFWFRIEEV